ncbi:hypothetical protein F4820DRAFT_143721 [Hypoxylon rubiginosum]|uniref:Uncharacterized protein n=1 Tax=Hypoxylon rubiginosum TaxID=110542 RepID=A0ACB9ZGA4_9PEZI|nr:hypothetical protein F4820DRAFT_143721 [Hypoxylon rubiginosum]
MQFNSISYTSSKALAWNPDNVLGLTNPLKCGITCVGDAHSQNRRCWNQIAQDNINSALSILMKFGSAPKAAASLADLRLAAELLLCGRHGKRSGKDQSSKIFSQWRLKLEDWISDHSDESSLPVICNKLNMDTRSVKREPQVKKEEPEEYSLTKEIAKMIAYSSTEEIRKMMARLEAELRRRSGKTSMQEDATERGQSQEQKRRHEQKEQERQREEEERRQREEKKREDERRREERKREERKREERKREERKREEQRREEKAREEAFRERVRLSKEKEKREAREKAQKETTEWQAAWKRYSDGWTKGADLSIANIAWPVKSGLRADVNEASVKLFFEKAPPAELVSSGEGLLELINVEIMRWHTDKVMQRFGPDVVNGAAKTALAIIAKVMIELRQEAQEKR